jgi:hypothetical protein
VRQLENTARWLTVMASTKEIHVGDLPPDLNASDRTDRRRRALGDRAADLDPAPAAPGETGILDPRCPAFEQILIQAALEHTGGRRQEAAKLLGWGRNTLTRKIKDLGGDIDDNIYTYRDMIPLPLESRGAIRCELHWREDAPPLMVSAGAIRLEMAGTPKYQQHLRDQA